MTQATNEPSNELQLPPSIVARDPAEGGVTVTVDAALYPLEALYGAAYIFIDRCYVLLDKAREGAWSVTLTPKAAGATAETLRAMVGEFANELLSQAWRQKILEENRVILETVTTQALAGAAADGAETRLLRLAELSVRTCEGFYSKAARACTWPCSITQRDPDDQMERVYEHLVHWADVVLLATPIRWGVASSLYFRMAERLNCVQNQITTHDRVLIRNKVAGFLIVGGQDNVQGVAGQLLGFFSELGFMFPQFPYVAHSRGWSAEDMERNVAAVRDSAEPHDGARALAGRALALSRHLLEGQLPSTPEQTPRGGRKAHRLTVIDR